MEAVIEKTEAPTPYRYRWVALFVILAVEVMDLLERIHEQGTTIIMVTHSPECASRAPRHIHLLDGRVLDTDANADLFAERTMPSLAAAIQ